MSKVWKGRAYCRKNVCSCVNLCAHSVYMVSAEEDAKNPFFIHWVSCQSITRLDLPWGALLPQPSFLLFSLSSFSPQSCYPLVLPQVLAFSQLVPSSLPLRGGVCREEGWGCPGPSDKF